MKIFLGFLLAFGIGVLCRLAGRGRFMNQGMAMQTGILKLQNHFSKGERA